MAPRSVLAAVLVSALLPGCYQSFEDAEVDGYADADVVHDADAEGGVRVDADAEADEGGVADVVRDAADVDGDTDADAYDDGDADGDAGACDGVWQDPTTGYLWENPPSETLRTWDDAISYCSGLSGCGYPVGEWHLPTISELRSLIRGCWMMETGGTCGVGDSCTALDDCYWPEDCPMCHPGEGPGAGGCYWPEGLSGRCHGYWSSSSVADHESFAWLIDLGTGYLTGHRKTTPHYGARCVGRGP